MAHIHEKIDFCSEVFVVYKNKVLLRKHDKYDLWLPPGGHVELDEDPVEAAIREVKEEVGLDFDLYDNREFREDGDILVPQFMNRHSINEIHEHICLVYFGTSRTDILEIPEHEKTDGVK